VKLDLSLYSDTSDYHKQTLYLKSPDYPSAWIEVGLKGKVSKDSGNTSINTSLNNS
jgi:hypothetical protein